MPDIAPLYFTVDSAGAINAVFPGGIELTAADNDTPPSERRIAWRRESDGALVAEMFAMAPLPTTNQTFIINETDDDPAALSAIELTAAVKQSLTTTLSADLTIQAAAADPNPGQVIATTYDASLGIIPTRSIAVLRSDGSSSLAQLPAPRHFFMTSGSGTITFPASAISNVLNVAHGLTVPPLGGVAPTQVICTRAGGTATGTCVIHVTGLGTPNFTAAAVSNATQAAGATLTFHWQAIYNAA